MGDRDNLMKEGNTYLVYGLAVDVSAQQKGQVKMIK